MRSFANRTEGFEDSIFAVMSQKAAKHNAINLSQGFPDFDGPEFIKKSASDYISKGFNQYAPFAGVPKLRAEISNVYSKWYDLSYNKDSEVTVVNGATEGIFATIQSLINPGDEVVVFEPVYDSYLSSIKLAGGIPVAVTLEGENFSYNQQKLEEAFSHQTKLVIINSPHNPTGKVFTESELKPIASLATKFDCFVLSDEVYEHLVYDDNKHIPFACLDGMKERTITISSAGKTFGLTGWKVGWCCANPEITDRIRKIHQYITFSIATPLQLAVAEALRESKDYLQGFKETYQKKRDLFMNGLSKMGINFNAPQGTYFIMLPLKGITKLNDVEFCEKLIVEHKVATIPPSAFYLNSEEGNHYLRICYAKSDDTLNKALENLQGL
ncbi:MAG: aminotransferase [Halobacteriovoraceae bacterium]|nr:aminotransferase [Halobacteriovoraceae bacterium]|tara:strand:- start:145466 stop:146617 length:1152 start_codon:yes stop_codon:yes gene_type:complete